jgi:hypothetical protein
MSMYINPAVSGKEDMGWLEAVARTYYESPVESALSLGCGGGALELQAPGHHHFAFVVRHLRVVEGDRGTAAEGPV